MSEQSGHTHAECSRKHRPHGTRNAHSAAHACEFTWKWNVELALALGIRGERTHKAVTVQSSLLFFSALPSHSFLIAIEHPAIKNNF